MIPRGCIRQSTVWCVRRMYERCGHMGGAGLIQVELSWVELG